MVKKHRINLFEVTILLFLAVFNPPLLPVLSFTIILSVSSVFYFFINIKDVLKLYNCNNIRRFLNLIVLFYLYYFICVIANAFGNNLYLELISTYFLDLAHFCAMILVSMMLVLVMKKKQITTDEVVQCFVMAGVLEGGLVVIAYFFPQVKTVFIELMRKDISSDRQWNFSYVSQFRNYGLASSLYDIFGYTIGILAVTSLDLALKGKRKNYIFFLILFFAGIVNARTTFVIVSMGALLLISDFRKKGNANIVIKGGLFIPIIILGVVFLFSTESSTIEWVKSGLEEIRVFFVNKEATGYFSTVINNFLFLPSSLLGIICGEGATPMKLGLSNTDVGYIQSIWTFGIIGSLLVYSAYLKTFRMASLSCHRYSRLMLAYAITFLIYQIKLNSLGYSQANIVLFPLFFYFSSEHLDKEFGLDKLDLNGN